MNMTWNYHQMQLDMSMYATLAQVMPPYIGRCDDLKADNKLGCALWRVLRLLRCTHRQTLDWGGGAYVYCT
jgi:hypothetical protein